MCHAGDPISLPGRDRASRAVGLFVLLATLFAFDSLWAQAPELDDLKKRLEKDQKEAEAEQAKRPQVSGPEGEALAEIDTRLARIPEDVRRSSLTAQQIQQLVDDLLVRINQFLTEYPDSSRAAELWHQLGRLASMNFQRAIAIAMEEVRKKTNQNVTSEQLEMIREAYLNRALSFLANADAKQPNEALRVEILQTKAKLYYFAQKHAEAAKIYRQLRTDFPDQGKPAENLMALINCLEEIRDHRGALELCGEFRRKFPTSQYAPDVVHLQAKLLVYLGRLEDAIAHLQANADYLMRAYEGQPIGEEKLVFPPAVRRQFEAYIDRMQFEIGFAHYALGQIEEAQQAFDRSFAWLSQKMSTGKLSQVGKIFYDRAHRLRTVLGELQGRPCPSLVPVDLWVSGGKFDVEANQGNVVALLFFPYGNERSEEFLRATQKFYEEHWSEGFRAAWVSYPVGLNDLPKQGEKLQAEAARLGVTMPVGLMTAEKMPIPLCGEFRLAFPTPTLVLVDRSGKVAWYKQDPTFRDFDTSHRVVRRLLREPAE